MRKNGETIICGVCGGEFYLSRSELLRGPEHWCSRTCADIGRKKGEVRACKVCGKSFYLHPSTIKNPNRTGEYCSNACQMRVAPTVPKGTIRPPEIRARMSAGQKGKKYPNAVKPPVEATCEHCGKVTLYSSGKNAPSQIQQRRFCGTDCWYEHIREHPEENPHWKDGLSGNRDYGTNWRTQAARARERDGYLCQMCKREQGRRAFSVHHIRPLREFGDDWRRANQLSNLITLCQSCHVHVDYHGLILGNPPGDPGDDL